LVDSRALISPGACEGQCREAEANLTPWITQDLDSAG